MTKLNECQFILWFQYLQTLFGLARYNLGGNSLLSSGSWELFGQTLVFHPVRQIIQQDQLQVLRVYEHSPPPTNGKLLIFDHPIIRLIDQHTDILQGRHNRMRCRTDKVGFEAYMIIDEGQGTIFLMHYIVYCCHRSNARVFS